ncbi:hypothetical protein [Nesterenkonia pannonica]|uniref:hypothetical protein n=1 Tax=Nesterenkonia pannonica TaxID=1548602 RepID=UPI002164D39B|nr:hypothetical protein [Nesterenkonia pannonica]
MGSVGSRGGRQPRRREPCSGRGSLNDDRGGIRAALRAHFDAVCEPFARPSHRLCLIEDPADGGHSQIVIGSDHAHVDAWSLLVLMRDLSTAIEDLVAGVPPRRTGRRPSPSQRIRRPWSSARAPGGCGEPLD